MRLVLRHFAGEPELPLDELAKSIGDFRVTWNRRGSLGPWIEINIVAATTAFPNATCTFKIANEITAFHAGISISFVSTG